jgi:hypothetical protein
LQTLGIYLIIATSAAAVLACGLTIYYVLTLAAAARRLNAKTPRSYLVTTPTGTSITLQPHGEISKTELKQIAVELLDDATEREELNPYPAAFARVVEHARRDVRETLALQYDIGRSASGDRITETHVTRTGRGGAPLLWRELRIWTVGSRTPSLQSFVELHDLELVEVLDDGSEVKLEWVPLPTTDECIRAVVLFSTELLPGQQRTWRFGYSIPGVWNSLREIGSDVCYYDLTNSVEYGQMTVDFVLPIEFDEPVIKLSSPLERRSAGPRQDGRSKTSTFAFSFDDPAPAEYVWELHLRTFAAAVHRQSASELPPSTD